MGVKFVTSLTDPGQPYSCESWQSSFGNTDAPLVIDENQSSTGLFSLLHDSWNAFPTFAILDHTMTVRVKPWTLDSNSNTNACDGSNATIDGFSGGDTDDFLLQLIEECGSLCEQREIVHKWLSGPASARMHRSHLHGELATSSITYINRKPNGVLVIIDLNFSNFLSKTTSFSFMPDSIS